MDGNAFDMDEAYGAMRPHQRGLFNMLGMAAVGGKKLIDAGANAFDTVGRIMGYGDPVTMDEVQRAAGDASMFAMPGTMGRKIAPRDEYMATKFGDSSPTRDVLASVNPTLSPYIRGPIGRRSIAPGATANGNVLGGGPLELYNVARDRQQSRAGARQYYQDMGEMPTAKTRDLEERLRLLNERERSMFGGTSLPENHPVFAAMDAERRALADALESSYLKPVK